jgi:hypothetical protein
MPASPRRFLADEDLVPGARDGRPGVYLTVRLTDYRSLPLSCIAGVRLTIDGSPVDPEGLVFILNGHAYPLPALRERTDLWWWVLDPAQLFVPLDDALSEGSHELEGTLDLIVPYATSGRSVRSSSARATVTLASDAAGSAAS